MHRLPHASLVTGVALSLLCCSGDRERSANAPSVTIGRQTPAAGAIRTERRTLLLDVAPAGQPLQLWRREVETRRIEVQSVAGNTLTRARITYVELSREERVNGQRRVKGNPLVGKTFGLALGDGRTVVTDGAGQPVSDPVARQVIARERQVGRSWTLHDGRPAGPVRIGGRVEGLSAPLSAELGRDLGSRSHPLRGLTVDQLEVTFSAVRSAGSAPHVVLTLSARVGLDDGAGLALGMRLRGELVLRQRDGWPVSLDLQGPLTTPDGKPAGSYHGQRTYAYAGVGAR